MTRSFIPLLVAVAAAGCGGGDSGSSYQQYEQLPAEYGSAASSYDPHADAYHAQAQQQMNLEAQAHMRELEEQQREWQRQKNADWAKGFTNPYD